MACQWRQVDTGPNWPASRPKTSRRLKMAKADFCCVGDSLGLYRLRWKSKDITPAADAAGEETALERLCQEGISGSSVSPL